MRARLGWSGIERGGHGDRRGVAALREPIDVDVLLLGSCEYSSGRLRLPHAEVVSRRFVLVPLLELDPELTLHDGRALAEALAALGGEAQEVRRVGGPLL